MRASPIFGEELRIVASGCSISSLSRFLTASSPPMSSQLTSGTLISVSRIADGRR